MIASLQLSNLTILQLFNFGNFGNFQMWQLSVLTIFSFGYFQATFLNGVQEQEQHINCMDLAIKKYSHVTM